MSRRGKVNELERMFGKAIVFFGGRWVRLRDKLALISI